MLLVYCGKEEINVRQVAWATVEKAGTEENITVRTIDSQKYSTGMIGDLIGACSLFGGKELCVLDTPSDNDVFNNEVKTHLADLADSVNQFIVIEKSLTSTEKKNYKKHAHTFEELTTPKPTSDFNVFELADALARKDKKTLWLLLQQAKRHGLVAEQVIGTLWWQLKTLRLAELTTTPEAAGVKAYPYQKAKRSLTHFKTGEVERLMNNLLTLYHNAHAGEADMDLSLERWTLTI